MVIESPATTLFIREEIHASVMEVFNYFVLGRNHTIKFSAQFPCINRVKGRASLCFTIAGTCRQSYFTTV